MASSPTRIASGRLQEILEQIAETREQEQKLRNKMFSALLYPSFLIVTATGIVVLLLLYVIPQFKQIILSAGADIPEAARFVIGASDWLNENFKYLAIAILVGLLDQGSCPP